MKTRDVQRGISSPNARSDGNTLNLGRVVRVRDSEIPNGERRGRRRDRRGDPARKRELLIWSSVLSVLTLIAIGMVVSFWLLPYLSRAPALATIPLVQRDSQVRVASKFPSPSREHAIDSVKQALTNRDPERLESLFRMGKSTRAEVLSFLNAAERRDGLVDRYEWLSSMDVDGLLLEGVLVIYKGKEKPVERLAFLTPDAAGNWKVDFGAFARTAEPPWHELLEQGGERAVVRVFVGQDVYFNGPFSDDKEWVCYGIASPDTEELLRGYCKVGSTLATAMGKLFAPNQKLSRATLEIRRVEQGGSRQFEIVRLVARDWVVADTADRMN